MAQICWNWFSLRWKKKKLDEQKVINIMFRLDWPHHKNSFKNDYFNNKIKTEMAQEQYSFVKGKRTTNIGQSTRNFKRKKSGMLKYNIWIGWSSGITKEKQQIKLEMPWAAQDREKYNQSLSNWQKNKWMNKVFEWKKPCKFYNHMNLLLTE